MTGDTRLILMAALPLLGVVLSALPWLVSRGNSVSPYLRFWLDALSLVLVCAGIVGAGVLAVFIPQSAEGSILGAELAMTPAVKVVVVALSAALIVVVLSAWDDGKFSSGPYLLAWASGTVGTLLTGAMLSTGRTIQGLLLFGVALVIMGSTLEKFPEVLEENNKQEQRQFASRLAASLKHLALAATGTALLLLGALVLSQHSLNLENRDLLQLGVGMLAVGLMLRAGAMPFAGAYGDLIRTAPGLALLALGAAVPGVLAVGLFMFAPVENASISSQSTGWLGAIAVLLAGLRALGIGGTGLSTATETKGNREAHLATLLSMTIAVQIGWTMVGVLSSSRLGATGALLLILNMTFTVPLLLISSRLSSDTLSRVGQALGIASLLGLPLLGGSIGTLMIAQAAANHSGIWLAILLLGTLLTGAGWLRSMAWQSRSTEAYSVSEEAEAPLTAATHWWNVQRLLVITLVIAQAALFLMSSPLTSILDSWINVPWLGTR